MPCWGFETSESIDLAYGGEALAIQEPSGKGWREPSYGIGFSNSPPPAEFDMKSALFASLIFLSACAIPPHPTLAISNEDRQIAQDICVQEGRKLGTPEFDNCYRETLNLVPQPSTGLQQFSQSMRELAAQQQAQQQQQQMLELYANRPEMAACMYQGQCGAYAQPQRTHTECRYVFKKLVCDSY